jgi:ABC-type glutathione transport system ATPase component
MSEQSFLEVEDLVVRFGGFVAVNNVSFTIGEGETLGLVGETGSGKTTIARAILGLVPVAGGRVSFRGDVIASPVLSKKRRRSRTGIQAVFQDPDSSLDPFRTIRTTLLEPLLVGESHLKRNRAELGRVLTRSLKEVGLQPSVCGRYPAELSGGQRQRVAIVRALLSDPKLVICDEPVTALDVSVQAQVLNVFRDVQDRRGLSYLFISHDLGVVRYMAHRVVVLYKGSVVESGPRERIYLSPEHAYTRELVAASG